VGAIASELRTLLQTEVDKNPGILIILQAHGTIILIIVQVFKQGDPLLVHVQTTANDDILRNRYRAYAYLLGAECFGYDFDHVGAGCVGRDRQLYGDSRACFLKNKHIQKLSIQEYVESDMLLCDWGHGLLKNDVFDVDGKLECFRQKNQVLVKKKWSF